jgi:hypothetical protein
MATTLDISWEILPEYVYNDIFFVHGEGAPAETTSLQKQMSTVSGHRHSQTYIMYPAKNLFAVQTPNLIDRKQLAFEYAKVDPKEWTSGCTVILGSKQPIIERL